MKILYATETYLPTINGAAIFTSKLAQEMAKRGHQVSIITTSSDLKEHVQNENGVAVYRLGSFSTILKPNQRFSLFKQKQVNKLVNKIQPEIVHIQNHVFIGSTVLNAARHLKIPVIGTNHMGPGDVSCFLPLPNPIKKIIDKLIWQHLASVYRKCNYLTAPSRFAFSLFAKHGVKIAGKVISNGIDLNLFSPVQSGKEEILKKKHNLPDKPIVLYTGRLDPGKELEVWIKSIPYILEKADVHFVLVGLGVSRKALEKLCGSLGIKKQVTFIDPVPYAEMPDYYRLATLFAISSVIEMQSLVVLEALASGLPLVAANSNFLPEVVDEGENGYLFEIGNSRMMAEKIVKILSDPRLSKNMGKKSLEIIKAHAVQKTYASFEELYRRIITPDSPR